MTPSTNSRILLDISRHSMHHSKVFQIKTMKLSVIGCLSK